MRYTRSIPDRRRLYGRTAILCLAGLFVVFAHVFAQSVITTYVGPQLPVSGKPALNQAIDFPSGGLCLICLSLCLIAVSLRAQGTADSLSGMWVGTWGPTPTHRNAVTLQLKWDGKTLTGTLNPGANAVKVQKTSFDPKTGLIHLEADAGPMGKRVHYVIDGKIDNIILVGNWNHDDRKGDFKLIRK